MAVGWGRGWGAFSVRLGVCVGVCVRACMCVGACTETCEHVCVCVCVSASARAGNSTRAGCLCFSVHQFHFVLYDYVCVAMYCYAIAFVCEYNLCIPYVN